MSERLWDEGSCAAAGHAGTRMATASAAAAIRLATIS
jgi:hypothetical protein